MVAYTESNFQGQWKVIDDSGSVGNWANNAISSLKMRPSSFVSIYPCVRIFKHRNYGGVSEVFCHDFNTHTSSLQLLCSDCSVELYTNNAFNGKSMSFSKDSHFIDAFLEDSIKSLIVYPFSMADMCVTLYEHGLSTGK